jgi:hypothetical protein
VNDSALLAAYRATTWTVALSAGETRIRLGSDPLAVPSLGIITAYNPASNLQPDDVNAAANRRLEEELSRTGAEVFSAVATGTGPRADQWVERGFAVSGLPRETLIALGVRYGQNAIVWIDERGQPSLVVTRPGFAGRAVGDSI